MARSLKIGLQLPEVEYEARWSDYLAMARLAERVGFDSLWVGDHLLYRDDQHGVRGPWECFTLLTALATVTTTVELGPLVASTSFRNPAMTAKIAESIDEISDGRFILGLGAGWNETEYRAYGYPYDHRTSRFEEAFTIIHRLIRTGSVSFDGEWYSAIDCTLVPRGPRAAALPILIGSTGERMLRITLPHVDQWNIWYADFGNTVTGLAPYLARLDRIAADVGRNPADIVRTAAVLVQAPGGGGRASGAAKERTLTPISGSTAEIAASLAEFGVGGIDHLQIVLDPITPEAIEWLAPALAEARQRVTAENPG
jgi:alkanesulfonate monooxygenase SsuD/methylene tetrahydromethanopterin reductase-like flavin-dependent oxidoreductase (luciferase family)